MKSSLSFWLTKLNLFNLLSAFLERICNVFLFSSFIFCTYHQLKLLKTEVWCSQSWYDCFLFLKNDSVDLSLIFQCSWINHFCCWYHINSLNLFLKIYKYKKYIKYESDLHDWWRKSASNTASLILTNVNINTLIKGFFFLSEIH